MTWKKKELMEISPSRGFRSKTKQKELEREDEMKDLGSALNDLRIADDIESSTESEESENIKSDNESHELDTPANNQTLYPATEDEQALYLRHLNGPLFERVYQAQVDEYLRSKNKQDTNPRIIVEVKPLIRSWKLAKVKMQESAQMAAWISNFPDEDFGDKTTFRRLLISQDRHEIYVTLARYDVNYLAYIRGDDKEAGKSFLHMNQFGPYPVTELDRMDSLGRLVLAYILQEYCS